MVVDHQMCKYANEREGIGGLGVHLLVRGIDIEDRIRAKEDMYNYSHTFQFPFTSHNHKQHNLGICYKNKELYGAWRITFMRH